MEISYEITVGKKVGSELIYTSDRHLFKIKKKPSHWLCDCHVVNCPAKVKIVNNCCSYINQNHIHGTQEETYAGLNLIAKVKQRCGIEKKTPREIFDEERSARPDASNIQFAKRQRTFQKHRRKGIPNNPNNVEEMKCYFEQDEIKARFGQTKHEIPKKFHHATIITALFSYVIFASEIILENLPPIQHLRIDGTFKVVPAGPFKQLLVISVDIYGHTFPLFYVLMTKKSQAAYVHLLKKIDQTWQLNPVSVTTDFEKGLRNALKLLYPNAKLIGCWFHYAQSLRRKVKKIGGFAVFLKLNRCAQKLYRKFVNLPLIRSDKIVGAFEIFKKEANNFGSRFTVFVNYFEAEWLKKVTPELFCVYLEKHRTNNLMESYNSLIKRKIPANGCFFRFIEFLQSEELQKSKDYMIIYNGGAQVYPPQKKKYREKDEFIFKYQTKFENGLMSIPDFFDKMDELEEDSDDEVDDDDESCDEDDVDSMLCVVCELNEKSVMFEPCNHVKVCQHCLNSMTGSSPNITCPACKKKITGHRIVFI